jgi:hypothetical protein
MPLKPYMAIYGQKTNSLPVLKGSNSASHEDEIESNVTTTQNALSEIDFQQYFQAEMLECLYKIKREVL